MNKYLALLLTTSLLAQQEVPKKEPVKKAVSYYFFVLETSILLCVSIALYKVTRKQPQIIERPADLNKLNVMLQDDGIVIKDTISGSSRFINCTFKSPMVNNIEMSLLYPVTPE